MPRPRKVEERLYPIENIEEKEEQVKIHYAGYDSSYDEWRPRDDIVEPIPQVAVLDLRNYKPFDFHSELAYSIKSSLYPKHTHGPEVRIDISFDLLIFNGGLKQAGIYTRTFRDHDIYTIESYNDLMPLLGSRWFIRILNTHQDFCAVVKNTVLYHIHRRAPLKEYSADGQPIEVEGVTV